MMNFLVANDDGFDALGIFLLVQKLSKYGNCYVVSPNTGKSASGHSIIIGKPISFEKVNIPYAKEAYKISGTPADCTRLGLFHYKDIKFDAVFSGVNNGLNLGTDTNYSGTCAVAREAMIEGVPSVAISTDFSSFSIVENELDNVLNFIFENNILNSNYYLNINFPVAKHKKSLGLRVSSLGHKDFKTQFTYVDGHYMEKYSEIMYDTDETSDVYLAYIGYTTITPITFQREDRAAYEKIKKDVNL